MKRALVVALAACGNPPPMVLDYALSQNPQQLCTTTTGQTASTCSDVTLRCASTLSVRIIAPDDPNTPFVSLCEPITTGFKDLCSIAGIDFPEPNRKVPDENLWIEVAVYATDSLCSDPNDPTGVTKLCPTDVGYDDTTGLPIDAAPICSPDQKCCAPAPAIGGRGLYRPGDKVTTVDLGCTNQPMLEDPSCSGPSTVTVAATVNDFDTGVSVSPAIADQRSVSVGEPRGVTVGSSEVFVLEPSDTAVLPRQVIQPVPGWDADVALQFMMSACLDVLEDAPQSTATLRCKQISPNPTRIDLVGVRLAKPTLDQLLAAVHLSAGFPPQGLVIGIVLDFNGNPVTNAVVHPSCESAASPCTIEYLSADRTTIIAGGTSANGIWLSQDASFPATFTTTNPQLQTQTAAGFGGLVQGKATIVVLQFGQPTTN